MFIKESVDLANIYYFYSRTLSEKSHKHITHRTVSTQNLLLLSDFNENYFGNCKMSQTLLHYKGSVLQENNSSSMGEAVTTSPATHSPAMSLWESHL